jgi:hypothetical protein
VDAARCQYVGDFCHELAFTGFDVWILVLAGLVLICVGLAIREWLR